MALEAQWVTRLADLLEENDQTLVMPNLGAAPRKNTSQTCILVTGDRTFMVIMKIEGFAWKHGARLLGLQAALLLH